MDTLETYKAVFESAPDGVVITDHQGKVLLVNNKIEKLFGYKKNDLIGKEIELLIPKIFNGEPTKNQSQYAAQPSLPEEETKKELVVCKKDASEFAAEIILSPIKLKDGSLLISAAIRDITERKKAEKTIHDSEQRFHGTLDNMMEGVQIISFDYRYLYVNDSLVKQSGYKREELLGYTMMEKYPGIENSKMYEVLKKCMTERVGQLLENEFRFPNNAIGYFELSIQPSEEGVFILSQDITTRKLNEIEIAASNKKLLSQNKELEQFTYITSHDLQEPLRSLISFSGLLQEEYSGKLSGDGNLYVNFISQSAMRMQKLVKALMDYSRIGKKRELTVVDCNQIINEILLDMFVIIKEKNAKITSQDLPTINGYSVEIRQLFQNLISNALKFQKKDSEPEINVSVAKQENTWIFSVKDNGIGIENKDLEKLFIVFRRLHNRNEYEGTGIGLAHCKKIIELHNGKIWVDSKLDEGSTFNFTISEI